MKLPVVRAFGITALLLFFNSACVASSSSPVVVLATTTSTQDTGLLDMLVPILEKEQHLNVKVVAVGSGEALAMGRRGDADVLLVHSPADEEKFMAEGYGALRLPVMHNDFVLLGPAADPALARGLSVLDALCKIAVSKAPWASRGDRSGTHKRELSLWQKAGLSEPGWQGAISTGQGMGETARIASEKGAYLLIDRGTYLALHRSLKLTVIAEGGADLLNSYSVIVVNPNKLRHVKAEKAHEIAAFFTSPPTKKLIGEYGVHRFGKALFVPALEANGSRGLE